MKLAATLCAILLSGCAEPRATAIEEIIKNCARPASIEFRASKWSREIVLKCDEIGAPAPKAADHPIREAA